MSEYEIEKEINVGDIRIVVRVEKPQLIAEFGTDKVKIIQVYEVAANLLDRGGYLSKEFREEVTTTFDEYRDALDELYVKIMRRVNDIINNMRAWAEKVQKMKEELKIFGIDLSIVRYFDDDISYVCDFVTD